MGRPAPLPLKYVEIGNEHPPALYGDYYVKFREAIKAKYPDITVVMSMYWSGLNHGAIERIERLNSLFSQAGYDQKSREVVIKATNYHGQPVEVKIELPGAKTVGRIGRHLLMRSASPSDQNTLDTPRRIVPTERPLESCAETFTVTLPPYSVNLLRFPAE